MANVEIKATRREATGKGVCRQLRLKGQLPAVMYSGGSDAVSLAVEARAIERILNSKQGERSILELDIDGKKQLAMIREIQEKTMTSSLVHVDFIRISMDHKVQVMVPVHLLGIEEIRKAGGVTQQTLTELDIECLPDRIPEFIEVDLSGKEIGDSVHISDLTMPEGVELLNDPEDVVASLISAHIADEGAEGAAEGAEAAEAEKPAAPEKKSK